MNCVWRGTLAHKDQHLACVSLQMGSSLLSWVEIPSNLELNRKVGFQELRECLASDHTDILTSLQWGKTGGDDERIIQPGLIKARHPHNDKWLAFITYLNKLQCVTIASMGSDVCLFFLPVKLLEHNAPSLYEDIMCLVDSEECHMAVLVHSRLKQRTHATGIGDILTSSSSYGLLAEDHLKELDEAFNQGKERIPKPQCIFDRLTKDCNKTSQNHDIEENQTGQEPQLSFKVSTKDSRQTSQNQAEVSNQGKHTPSKPQTTSVLSNRDKNKNLKSHEEVLKDKIRKDIRQEKTAHRLRRSTGSQKYHSERYQNNNLPLKKRWKLFRISSPSSSATESAQASTTVNATGSPYCAELTREVGRRASGQSKKSSSQVSALSPSQQCQVREKLPLIPGIIPFQKSATAKSHGKSDKTLSEVCEENFRTRKILSLEKYRKRTSEQQQHDSPQKEQQQMEKITKTTQDFYRIIQYRMVVEKRRAAWEERSRILENGKRGLKQGRGQMKCRREEPVNMMYPKSEYRRRGYEKGKRAEKKERPSTPFQSRIKHRFEFEHACTVTPGYEQSNTSEQKSTTTNQLESETKIDALPKEAFVKPAVENATVSKATVHDCRSPTEEKSEVKPRLQVPEKDQCTTAHVSNSMEKTTRGQNKRQRNVFQDLVQDAMEVNKCKLASEDSLHPQERDSHVSGGCSQQFRNKNDGSKSKEQLKGQDCNNCRQDEPKCQNRSYRSSGFGTEDILKGKDGLDNEEFLKAKYRSDSDFLQEETCKTSLHRMTEGQNRDAEIDDINLLDTEKATNRVKHEPEVDKAKFKNENEQQSNTQDDANSEPSWIECKRNFAHEPNWIKSELEPTSDQKQKIIKTEFDYKVPSDPNDTDPASQSQLMQKRAVSFGDEQSHVGLLELDKDLDHHMQKVKSEDIEEFEMRKFEQETDIGNGLTWEEWERRLLLKQESKQKRAEAEAKETLVTEDFGTAMGNKLALEKKTVESANTEETLTIKGTQVEQTVRGFGKDREAKFHDCNNNALGRAKGGSDSKIKSSVYNSDSHIMSTNGKAGQEMEQQCMASSIKTYTQDLSNAAILNKHHQPVEGEEELDMQASQSDRQHLMELARSEADGPFIGLHSEHNAPDEQRLGQKKDEIVTEGTSSGLGCDEYNLIIDESEPETKNELSKEAQSCGPDSAMGHIQQNTPDRDFDGQDSDTNVWDLLELEQEKAEPAKRRLQVPVKGKVQYKLLPVCGERTTDVCMNPEQGSSDDTKKDSDSRIALFLGNEMASGKAADGQLTNNVIMDSEHVIDGSRELFAGSTSTTTRSSNSQLATDVMLKSEQKLIDGSEDLMSESSFTKTSSKQYSHYTNNGEMHWQMDENGGKRMEVDEKNKEALWWHLWEENMGFPEDILDKLLEQGSAESSTKNVYDSEIEDLADENELRAMSQEKQKHNKQTPQSCLPDNKETTANPYMPTTKYRQDEKDSWIGKSEMSFTMKDQEKIKVLTAATFQDMSDQTALRRYKAEANENMQQDPRVELPCTDLDISSRRVGLPVAEVCPQMKSESSKPSIQPGGELTQQLQTLRQRIQSSRHQYLMKLIGREEIPLKDENIPGVRNRNQIGVVKGKVAQENEGIQIATIGQETVEKATARYTEQRFVNSYKENPDTACVSQGRSVQRSMSRSRSRSPFRFSPVSTCSSCFSSPDKSEGERERASIHCSDKSSRLCSRSPSYSPSRPTRVISRIFRQRSRTGGTSKQFERLQPRESRNPYKYVSNVYRSRSASLSRSPVRGSGCHRSRKSKSKSWLRDKEHINVNSCRSASCSKLSATSVSTSNGNRHKVSLPCHVSKPRRGGRSRSRSRSCTSSRCIPNTRSYDHAKGRRSWSHMSCTHSSSPSRFSCSPSRPTRSISRNLISYSSPSLSSSRSRSRSQDGLQTHGYTSESPSRSRRSHSPLSQPSSRPSSPGHISSPSQPASCDKGSTTKPALPASSELLFSSDMSICSCDDMPIEEEPVQTPSMPHLIDAERNNPGSAQGYEYHSPPWTKGFTWHRPAVGPIGFCTDYQGNLLGDQCLQYWPQLLCCQGMQQWKYIHEPVTESELYNVCNGAML